MRLEHNANSHTRLLRKPSLSDVSATKPKAQRKTQQSKGSRFVGPAHLDDDQKARFCRELEKRKVGDEIGRQIFIGAVEYQLSAFGDRLEKRQEPEQKPLQPNTGLQNRLQAILETARTLSGLLRDLPHGSREELTRTLANQDELGRGYDERYLCQLGCEIDRLERACVDTTVPAETPARANGPAPCPEFATKLAEIFSECFELEPTADPEGPFHAALEVLGEVTGLFIGDEPELLSKVLAKS